jgi:hypothetical protein
VLCEEAGNALPGLNSTHSASQSQAHVRALASGLPWRARESQLLLNHMSDRVTKQPALTSGALGLAQPLNLRPATLLGVPQAMSHLNVEPRLGRAPERCRQAGWQARRSPPHVRSPHARRIKKLFSEREKQTEFEGKLHARNPNSHANSLNSQRRVRRHPLA